MRGLNRNKRLIYYARRTGEVANTDEWGNLTGEFRALYSAVTPLLCNISAASGEDVVLAFGNFTDYSRTVYVADTNCRMDVDSIVWFGADPSKPHNYIVTRKSDSKNGLLYFLREVKVT